MTLISAVIITLNEERNIGRCIDSLLPVADEIIVLDSFSTDNTKAICKEKGVVFIEREWQGYSNAKNFANSKATHEYILSIDADEAISPELKDSILNAKKQGLSGIYEMNRLTNYCGKWIKHCGWYPDKKTRLFLKSIAQWQGDFVHEEIHFEGHPAHHFLQGDLLHYSYYQVSEHKSRIEKYASLAALKLQAKGKKGGKIKGTIKAISRFVKMYFFKLGIVDGAMGLQICRLSAYAVYLRYVKLQELNTQ